MSNFRYNYVFFNSADSNTRKKDPNTYNTICAKDLDDHPDIQVVSYPVDWAPYFIRFLFSVHHHPKTNKIVKLPFKRWWYPHWVHPQFAPKKPLCFVFCDWKSLDYIRYLKKKYPKSKIVFIHRDKLSLFEQTYPEWTNALLDELVDLRLSYDEKEAADNNLGYFCEYESAIDLAPSEDAPICDVFFAGRAKDRLPLLMDVYHKVTAGGLSCHYYLTHVPTEQQKAYPGIEYSNRQLPYREMLQRSVDARCMLEINQGGSVGYTSRFLEAVIYNKKLLTNNKTIENTKFYNPEYIQCFNVVDDINVEFIKKDVEKIDFHYNGEFSPIRLIEQIDRELMAGEEETV